MDPNIPVSRIMTRTPVSVLPTTQLEEIKAIFDRNSFHHIPVVAPGSAIVGIVSKTDILIFLRNREGRSANEYYNELRVPEVLAKDVMTDNLIKMDPADSVGLAADIILGNEFHSIPVVEDDVLLGIVTSHDIIQYAFKGVIMGEEA